MSVPGQSPPSGAIRLNSEGKTVAESWRDQADRLICEARVLERQAERKRESAANYRQMADRWAIRNG